MIVNYLFLTVKQLNKSDKILLLQYLVKEIAAEEEINTTEEKDKFGLATISQAAARKRDRR